MQSFHEWQQSPVQGAIPTTPNPAADAEAELALLREKLLLVQQYLAEAKNLIHSTGLSQTYSDIYSDIAALHFHCDEAIEKIDQHPQPDQ